MRQIKIVSASKGSKTLQSSATSWGQLKDAISSDYPDIDKMNVVIKETKTALVLDESVLPEGDFQIFLAPKNIKAGGLSRVEVLTKLREKLSDAIDELIDEIEEDEDNDDDDFEDDDDQRLLSKISGL